MINVSLEHHVRETAAAKRRAVSSSLYVCTFREGTLQTPVTTQVRQSCRSLYSKLYIRHSSLAHSRGGAGGHVALAPVFRSYFRSLESNFPDAVLNFSAAEQSSIHRPIIDESMSKMASIDQKRTCLD